MGIRERLEAFFGKDTAVKVMIRIIGLLLIIYLCYKTSVVWEGVLDKVVAAVFPFAIGFVLAFIFRPLIRKAEEHKISRKFVVPILYLVILVLIFWLFYTLIPLFFSRFSSILTSITNGIQWLYDAYLETTENTGPNWLTQVFSALVSVLNEFKNVAPTITGNITKALSQTLGLVTRALFTLIISIYICNEWESLTEFIVAIATRIHPSGPEYLRVVGNQVGSYVRSMAILILVKFIEYSILYAIIGHPDWMLVALLTALGLIIPYIGPMLANVIGILTALATLPLSHCIVLVIMIVVLSNIDAYIIEPMIHSHNVKISPLWALFSIYAGGILFGAVGIMLGIPFYLSVRAAIRLHKSKQSKQPSVV